MRASLASQRAFMFMIPLTEPSASSSGRAIRRSHCSGVALGNGTWRKSRGSSTSGMKASGRRSSATPHVDAKRGQTTAVEDDLKLGVALFERRAHVDESGHRREGGLELGGVAVEDGHVVGEEHHQDGDTPPTIAAERSSRDRLLDEPRLDAVFFISVVESG